VSHDDEYHANMVRMLELIWGEGYMAPGGPGNVAKLLRGIVARDLCILDIGCGLGGPALEMALTHGARVVGIDLEAPLVDRAKKAAERAGLADRCAFQVVVPGSLPFDNESFDIVTSSGAVTQTADAGALFAEAHRVLRPGGWLSCYEWLCTDREYSEDMHYWFRMEGLTYAMKTFAQYSALLEEAGFASVAAPGFQAPGVVVSYTDDPDIQNGSRFAALGLQIAAGVPLMCGEPEDYRSFRIGLFGLDKLGDVAGTVDRLRAAVDAL